MSEIEKRAIELLVSEYRKCGQTQFAEMLEIGDFRALEADKGAIAAIMTALTPPEGYVLVPVEPTEEMRRRGTVHVSNPCGLASDVWAAMLDARPEVSP